MLGRRQLFIYWRVAGGDAASAQAAARQLQASLRNAQAGMHAALFVRSDTLADEATFMETYALAAQVAADGIPAALQQHIVEAGRLALQPWLRTARHVEVFDACAA